jgi:hypothetical protein
MRVPILAALLLLVSANCAAYAGSEYLCQSWRDERLEMVKEKAKLLRDYPFTALGIKTCTSKGNNADDQASCLLLFCGAQYFMLSDGADGCINYTKKLWAIEDQMKSVEVSLASCK